MKRILFVCLGNICRSSSAEEVMRTLIKKKGLEHEIEVDSAGIHLYLVFQSFFLYERDRKSVV